MATEEVTVRILGEVEDSLRRSIDTTSTAIEQLKGKFPIEGKTDVLEQDLVDVEDKLKRVELAAIQVRETAASIGQGAIGPENLGRELGDVEAGVGRLGTSLRTLRGDLGSTFRDLNIPADAIDSLQETEALLVQIRESTGTLGEDFKTSSAEIEFGLNQVLRRLRAIREGINFVGETGLSDNLVKQSRDARAELDLLEREIEETKDALRDIPEPAADVATELRDAGRAGIEGGQGLEVFVSRGRSLITGVGAVLISLRAMRSELDRIAEDLGESFPEAQEKIETSTREIISALLAFPFFAIRQGVTGITDEYDKWIEGSVELSEVLKIQVERGEDVVSLTENMNEELRNQEPLLQRQATALGLVVNHLEQQGKLTGTVARQLAEQAKQLADEFVRLGVEVPDTLARIREGYRTAGDEAERLKILQGEFNDEVKEQNRLLQQERRDRAKAAEQRERALRAFLASVGAGKEAIQERTAIAVEGSQKILEQELLTVEVAERLRSTILGLIEEYRVLGEEAPESLRRIERELRPIEDLQARILDSLQAQLDKQIEQEERLAEAAKRRQDILRANLEAQGLGDEGDVDELRRRQERLNDEVERFNDLQRQRPLELSEQVAFNKAIDAQRQATIALNNALKNQTGVLQDQIVVFGPLKTEQEAQQELLDAWREQLENARERQAALNQGIQEFERRTAGATVQVVELADGTRSITNVFPGATAAVQDLAEGEGDLAEKADAAAEATARSKDEIGQIASRADAARAALERLGREGSASLALLQESLGAVLVTLEGIEARTGRILDDLREISELE
jgi:hypothetical protein